MTAQDLSGAPIPRPHHAALPYLPELDFLRAIAVLGVLYAHVWTESSVLGTLGVKLFFVLSGFLITDILLGLRQSDCALATPLPRLVNFFIRRALRIWPAYYLLLGLLIIANFQNIRDVAGWHLMFASNILFAVRNEHLPWATSPWWSLSVEEQFYLLWPAVMLLPPLRAIPWIIGLLIYAGILFEFGVFHSGYTGLGAYYLPPAAFLALGTGALLSFLRFRHGSIPTIVERMGWAALPLVVLLTVTSRIDWTWGVLSVVSMAAMVTWGARGGSVWARRITRSPPMLWIGRRSYGIYLYHVPLLAIWFSFIPEEHFLHPRGPLLFAAGLATSLAVAGLSWAIVEGPANRLKRLFPYRSQKPTA